MEKTTICDIGNIVPCLAQAHNCDSIKPTGCIPQLRN